MSVYQTPAARSYVLAVSISPGGIPKRPQESARALVAGLMGDGRNHAKHIRPDRALSLWDHEILLQLVAEGFQLTPGAAGENLTVCGLNVQQMSPGTLLRVGDVVLKLEQPRKPCYVLDTIDPRLKEVIVGRCGYMASVLRVGVVRPGMSIDVVSLTDSDLAVESVTVWNDVESPPGTIAYHMLAGPAVG
jgi:MOSC domain-containing protein YiiM